MIQTETILHITDNSGIKKIRCLKILGSQKQYGFNGTFLCGSINKLKRRKNKKIPFYRGNLVLVLIIQTKFFLRRNDGERVGFLRNAGVVVDKQLKPFATRIFNPVCSEFRKKRYAKLLSAGANFLV
jgi:large subunit ribosomal protein L14